MYTSPAGMRPAGPSAASPFDAVLPDGRIVAPVGLSVGIPLDTSAIALTPDGRFAILGGQGSALTVVQTSDMAITDRYAAVGEAFTRALASVRDPALPARTLVLAGGTQGLQFFEVDAFGKLHDLQTPVAVSTQSIAIAPGGRVAYAVDSAHGSITAIDLAARTALQSAQAGALPWDAAVAGHRLYVTNPYPPSELSSINLAETDDVQPVQMDPLRMDVPLDGVQLIGSAAPSALAVSKNGAYAYVCMTNVDRVAIADLLGISRVVGGLDLRLFENAPYGTRPDAIVRSPDGTRVYVALAGMDAVAVLDSRDPAKLHRLGLIPTGWDPASLAVSPNGRFLYVVNAHGFSNASLQRIDMHRLPLRRTTMSALRYLRVPRRAAPDPVVPPLRSAQRSSVVKHVIFVYAAAAAGDSPNARALATQFASAANYYAADLDPQSVAAAGIATSFGYPRSGLIFNAAARGGLTYRDYGGFIEQPAGAEPLAALTGHDDAAYPATGTDDGRRVREFVRDYAQQLPDFAYVVLPRAADADAALGAMVEALTRMPAWSDTAIFITGASPTGTDAGYAVVVSPYARRHYSGEAHLSTASILKTEEELLGLPPLALGDLLTTDMSGFFTAAPDSTPFTANTAGS
jgi:DNA-binding beta-propeller fold protein YncE